MGHSQDDNSQGTYDHGEPAPTGAASAAAMGEAVRQATFGASGIGMKAAGPVAASVTGMGAATVAGSCCCSTPVRRSPHPIWWLIAGSLVVITVTEVSRTGGGPLSQMGRLGNTVFGQTTAGGARGVFAFSGQLTKSTYGVFVVDVDTMNIWAYEYLPQKSCLRLASARTWRYDRYLENHNVCDLPPEAVEEMIERQRAYRIDKVDEQLPKD